MPFGVIPGSNRTNQSQKKCSRKRVPPSTYTNGHCSRTLLGEQASAALRYESPKFLNPVTYAQGSTIDQIAEPLCDLIYASFSCILILSTSLPFVIPSLLSTNRPSIGNERDKADGAHPRRALVWSSAFLRRVEAIGRPAGTTDNSPAFQRRVWVRFKMSPEGTADMGPITSTSIAHCNRPRAFPTRRQTRPGTTIYGDEFPGSQCSVSQCSPARH